MPPKSGSEPAAGADSPQRSQAANTSSRVNVLGGGGAPTSSSNAQLNRSRSRSPSASPQFGSRRVASPAGIAFGTLPTIPSSTALNITGLSESAGLGTSRIRIGNHNNGSNADLLGHDSDSLSISSSPRSSHSFFNSGNATQQGEGMGNKGRSGNLAPSGSMSIAIGSSASNSTGSTPSGSIAIRSSSLAYPDPIGSGSPREQRLYERGNTTPSTATANAFSSSFPNSSIWLHDKPAALASSPTTAATSAFSSASGTATQTSRNLLSRHLSMSGNASRSDSLSRSYQAPGAAGVSMSEWPDSPRNVTDDSSADLESAREGRSRTRHLLSSSIADASGKASSPANVDTSGTLSRSLSIASGRRDLSAGALGIAASNMSPFVRDVNQLPLIGPSTANPLNTGRDLSHIGPGAASTASRHGAGSMLGNSERAGGRQSGSTAAGQYSASYTASRDFFPESRGLTGRPNYAIEKPFGMGDFSLGAVGSGRRRRDSYWGNERSLREGDEDLDFSTIGRGSGGFGSTMATSFSEDDEDEDYAPPTRSGATSRRHSVAAFTSSSTLTSLSSPPPRSQIGFHLPGDALTMSSSSTSRRNPHQAFSHGRSASSNFASHLGEGSSSRLDDEDLLATDLSNALQLNLDAQAARDRSAQHNQTEMLSPRVPLSGLQSQASSLPIHSSHNFPQDSSGSSPYSSSSMAIGMGARVSQQGVGSTSPPRTRTQRASSTSGDPYSPSASAARFLATAHHVQPPPLQPQQVAQLQHSQQQPYSSSQSESQRAASPNMWPQQAAGLFAEGSPYARSGTLPPPEYLQNYGNSGTTQTRDTSQGAKSTVTHLPSTFNPSAQPFGFGHQDMASSSLAGLNQGQQQQQPNQPAHFSLNQTQISPARSGPMPPFAGFAGMNAQQYHHSGPTQTISHLNAHAQPYYVAPIAPQPSLNDLGRGVPLHALPSGGPLYIIEFKAGRTDLFYIDDPNHLVLQKGDLVVVEADRGKDLGKCLTSCTLDEVRDFQMHQVESALGQLAANAGGGPTIGGITPVPLPPGQQPTAAVIARMTKEIHPKKIYGRASPADVALLALKAQDEAKALNVCRAKVVQHQLPMEVTDAEFQFDRRRLTFFYIADRRIDFRNLVKDLFRLYKTRIWLCAVEGGQIQPPQSGHQMSGYGMSSDM